MFLCARACVPLLGDGASIVLMGSIASVISSPGVAAYSATKGAVLQLARGMALDFAASGRGVRVNVVCPGVCETPMMRRNIEGPAAWTTREQIAAEIPIGRLGTAEEIARATLFFASDDSSFCTGTSLLADGGVTAHSEGSST